MPILNCLSSGVHPKCRLKLSGFKALRHLTINITINNFRQSWLSQVGNFRIDKGKVRTRINTLHRQGMKKKSNSPHLVLAAFIVIAAFQSHGTDSIALEIQPINPVAPVAIPPVTSNLPPPPDARIDFGSESSTRVEERKAKVKTEMDPQEVKRRYLREMKGLEQSSQQQVVVGSPAKRLEGAFQTLEIANDKYKKAEETYGAIEQQVKGRKYTDSISH